MAEVFSREYVEKIRRESQRYRDRAHAAEDRVRALEALVEKLNREITELRAKRG